LATLYNSEPFIQADQEQEKTDELVNVAYFGKCCLLHVLQMLPSSKGLRIQLQAICHA